MGTGKEGDWQVNLNNVQLVLPHHYDYMPLSVNKQSRKGWGSASTFTVTAPK